ncbi:MAG: dipeptidyl aminopeptidase/acylaminoacyl peptidase [Myxococcota bacterium]|jgi:dipeptidyl aminopeptidase/acylaminoacyl peptidase
MSFDSLALVALRRVSSVAASPCGTWLAVAAQRLDEEGAKFISDLWRVPVAGGAAEPLTDGEGNDRAPAFGADGTLYFLTDRKTDKDEGEGRSQVWRLGSGDEDHSRVTDEPLGVSRFAASRTGALVLLAPVLPDVPFKTQRTIADDRKKHGPSMLRYTNSPTRHWDHYVPVAAPHVIVVGPDGDRRDLSPGATRAYRDSAWDLSADGSTLVITSDQGLHSDRVPDILVDVFDLASGSRTTVGQGEGVWYQAPRVSADGRWLAVQHHTRLVARHGRRALQVLDLTTGQGRVVAEGWDRWPSPECWTADGRVVCTVDDQATVGIVAIDPKTDEITRVTTIAAGGTHLGITPLGDAAITGIRSSFLQPPEAFVCALDGEAHPQIPATVSGLDPQHAEGVRVETMRVPVEGAATEIQAWVVSADDEVVRPGVMWIHGGPIHAWADTWHWRWNVLVAVHWGYRVVLPNPSGSTGFGQELVEAIWNNSWGDQCYRDLMGVTDAFSARPDVAAERVSAMGGSFGGYMANWIGGQTDRFAALISHAGIFDTSAFHGVTDTPGWWILMNAGMDPWRQRTDFDRHSPRNHIANWKTPTLVIHGDKDYRCPVGEGLALFESLQSHDVPSELLIYPDENHWIMKPRNIVTWYDAVADWLNRYSGT